MKQPRVIELHGSPRQIGLGHGEAMRVEIAACVAIYRELFAMSDAVVRQRAVVFEQRIRAFDAALAEEIEGIADAADMPRYWIFALNARSEMVPFSLPECTAIFSPETGVLAQTWDWDRRCEDLVFVMRVTRPDGHRFTTVTEPGILAKIGLSTAGLGVCLNFLAAPRTDDGVPIHLVLRAVLESRNLDEAIARVHAAGLGKSGNVMIGNASGPGFNVEFAGDNSDERRLTMPFVHTNHCLFRDLGRVDEAPSSYCRFGTAQTLAASAETLDVATIKQILSDTSQRELSICRPYDELHGMSLGTVCTVIMDLRHGELYFRYGPNPDAAFHTF